MRPIHALPALLLTGCTSLDALLYNPEKTDQYSLSGEIVPGSAVEQVTFSSGDLTLYGAWARQETWAPPVVFFHGNEGNMDTYWSRVEQIWGWGYDVFTFDYRGYGRSEGEPSLEGLEEDGRAAVLYAAESHGGLPGNLSLIGLSLGGAVAIRTARDHPPLVLVTEDTFADLDFLLDQSAGGLDLAAGWFFHEDWDNVAALSQVRDVPTFIVHAREDSYIPVDNADRLYAVAPEPKELWAVPGADHAQSNEVAADAYERRVTAWIEQGLAGLEGDDTGAPD